VFLVDPYKARKKKDQAEGELEVWSAGPAAKTRKRGPTATQRRHWTMKGQESKKVSGLARAIHKDEEHMLTKENGESIDLKKRVERSKKITTGEHTPSTWTETQPGVKVQRLATGET